jgi:hypothetical protein
MSAFDARRAYPLVLILLVLALVTGAKFFLLLSVALVAILIARPSILEIPAELLGSVARLAGTALSNVVLTVVFYVFVVPYGYFYRTIEKQLRAHFFESRGKHSYFTKATRRYGPADFEKPW